MFKIKVSNAIIDYARNLLVDHNFGNRGIADGNVHEQLTGLIGQCTIQTLFHVDLLTGAGGFDHGKDLEFAGLAIDVKTMGRTTDVKDYYVNNFIALQKDYPTDAYIFCSYFEEKKELTVCGWLPKNEMEEKANFYKKGTKRFRSDKTWFRTKADLYEIPNKHLMQVKTPDDLKQQLSEFATSIK
ncbi:MAG: hypothetical protein IIB45_04055 [Candidatus Marinimicrobia bacterium]|nr:hypothetical protein [Candidatus Neomarinimicrobiota bacterium]